MNKEEQTPEALIHKAEESVSLLLMRFDRISSSHSIADVYCFYEGDDAPYYQHRIKNISGKESLPIKCGNKKKVIAVFNDMKQKEEYRKYKTLYFVDRDFDDNSKLDSDIYVTPCYSIENFYIHEECIKNILMAEYDLVEGGDEQYGKVIKLYQEELETFHSIVLLFNAWYACLKPKLKNDGPNLKDNFPANFIHLEIKNIQSKYNLESIETLYPQYSITEMELEAKKYELKHDCSRYLRGKFEVQFLYVFLEFLNIDAKGKKEYTKKCGVGGVNAKKIISQYSQYAYEPECLRNYISKRCA